MLPDQKSHVSPHVHYLDQINAVAALMIPLASHDADAGANGIAQPKTSSCI